MICLHWAPKAFGLGDDDDVKASMCEESGRSDFSLQSSFECSGAPARMIIRLMYGGESTLEVQESVGWWWWWWSGARAFPAQSSLGSTGGAGLTWRTASEGSKSCNGHDRRNSTTKTIGRCVSMCEESRYNIPRRLRTPRKEGNGSSRF